MTKNLKYPDEIFAVQYSNGIVGAHDGRTGTTTEHRKYVLADRGSLYQEKDIDALMAEIDRLRWHLDKITRTDICGPRDLKEAQRIACEALKHKAGDHD